MLERIRSTAVAVAVAAIIALAATAAWAQEGDAAADPALLERGVVVYREQGCGICHALAAAGTAGGFGPGHDAMGVVAGARLLDGAYAGEAEDATGYIRESIVAPRAYVVPGYAASYHRMPTYDFLSDQDVNALVALLAAQPHRPTGGER